jgi:RecJ-like exonuclease
MPPFKPIEKNRKPGPDEKTCPTCDGTGRVDNRACTTCNGSGVVPDKNGNGNGSGS